MDFLYKPRNMDTERGFQYLRDKILKYWSDHPRAHLIEVWPEIVKKRPQGQMCCVRSNLVGGVPPHE